MLPGGNAGDGGRLASTHPETGRYKEGMMEMRVVMMVMMTNMMMMMMTMMADVKKAQN